jgi:hypothetical protein
LSVGLPPVAPGHSGTAAERRGFTQVRMTRQDIAELAAILVAEHGCAALQMAEDRRDQHGRERNSPGYELWDAIVAEVARRLDHTAPAAANDHR